MNDVPERLQHHQIVQGMFADPEFNKNHNLRFCLRMLPHHSDDGGFFAALIRKVKPLPWEHENRNPQELLHKNGQFYSPRLRKSLKRETITDPIPRKPKAIKLVQLQDGRKVKSYYTDYREFQFVEKGDEEIENLLDFYDLNLDPALLFRFGKSNVYLCNEAIKDMILGLEIQNVFFAGLRLFEQETKERSAIQHKITWMGRSVMLDMIGDGRTAKIKRGEMLDLLKSESLKLNNDFSAESLASLDKISTYGPLKIYCDLDKGSTYDCLAFKGQEKLLLQNKSAEKFHGLLLLKRFE